jgi:molybdopterin-guanine dinucleotide biosynthesis protein A
MEKSGTAIILAGGKSSRMGEDKGLMLVNGKPMIQSILDQVSQVANEILIVTSNPNYARFGYSLIPDLIENKGPLAGIVSGLSHSSSVYNWVLSCDIPYITASLLLKLKAEIGDNDVIVAKKNLRIHPLIGCYKKDCVAVLNEQLNSGDLKLMNALNQLKVKEFEAVDFDEKCFQNINSKADL